MNRYGHLMQDRWTEVAPVRTAALPDPTAFFTEMGDQIAAEVAQLTDTLTALDQLPPTTPDPAIPSIPGRGALDLTRSDPTRSDPTSSGPGYLQRVARWDSARRQAEEIVLADYTRPPTRNRA